MHSWKKSLRSTTLAALLAFSSTTVALAAPNVTLNVHDGEVRDVLTAISALSDASIVTDESVKGKITIALDNVPFNTAIKLITSAKGLAYRMVDGVILVSTQENLNKFNGSVNVFKLNYAKAEDVKNAGLETGMKKDNINVEEIVNKIRLKRNDISWIGISLKGTNAIVKVVKAKEAPELVDEKEYTNIIAKKAGTITQIIAQNGTAQVKVGDDVEEGQILIQGVMEGKYTGIRNVHSLGEVKAIVKHSKTEKFPIKEEQNVKTGKKETKYEIKFNKFQINFYKTLSNFKIYDTIEEEKKFRIFSNLYLPISVIKITNEELVKNSNEYTIEEITARGTKQLEEKIENEIENKNNILRKKCRSNRSRKFC